MTAARAWTRAAGLAAALLAAAPAGAITVTRGGAQGVIPLVEGAAQGLGAPITVRPGEVAWTESLTPELNVRLLEPLPARADDGAPGIPAGTVLFGYRLANATVFCPRAPFDSATPNVQCLADDGTTGAFDVSYVSDAGHLRSQLAIAYVRELGGAPSRRYVPVDPDAVAPVAGAMLFAGERDGKLTFRLKIDRQLTDSVVACEPVPGDGSICIVDGLTFRITRHDGPAVRLELLGVADRRETSLVMTGAYL